MSVHPRDEPDPCIEDSAVVAVVDTNVLIDVFSMHDMINHYEVAGEDAIDSPESVFRRARVRESLLLAMHFSALGAHTYSLGAEAARILVKNAPPETESDPTNHYVKIFLYFVRLNIMPGWFPRVDTEDGLDDLKGNDADQALVDYAQRCGLPLITNEGYGAKGITDAKGLRKRATDAGVAVFRPADFYARKIDEALEVGRVFTQFERHKDQHIADARHPKIMAESLKFVQEYYRHVPCWVTEGRSLPVAMRSPPPSKARPPWTPRSH